MKYLSVFFLLFSSSVYAGGWTNFATPSQIDIERGGGFMVFGSFGNAGNCVVADMVYIKIDHPQYKELYSAALTAFTAGKKISMYIHGCEPIGWYSVPATTYNIMDASSALKITN